MAKKIFRIITISSFLILACLGTTKTAHAGCVNSAGLASTCLIPPNTYSCTVIRASGSNLSACCSDSDSCVALKASGAQKTAGTKKPIFYPTGKCGEGAIDTALGCIPYTTDAFGPALLGFLAGTVGAIALIVMLFATAQIMMAGGDAEAVKKAKELFTGAVTGLLFIIFSVTLLKIIAGDIIQLPGFGG